MKPDTHSLDSLEHCSSGSLESLNKETQAQISRKKVGAKYSEISDIVNRETFWAVLGDKLSDGEILIEARYFITVKSNKYKEKRY